MEELKIMNDKQNPGILPGLELRDFGPQEIQIINNLSAFWFVSGASILRTGKRNRFPYAFLKPTDLFIQRFNFHAQLLCIFHNYPEVDGRLLEAIDKIIATNGHRVDRLCIVLVTNGEVVSSTLSRFEADGDPRIMVAFRYHELTGGVSAKEALMIRRLEETLYTKDLFSISSVLKTERYFYGRKTELQRLIGQYNNGENGSLFGLRRIGKSSLLWAVLRTLKQMTVPVAFLDCSDPGFHKTKWNKALFRVKDTLFRANGMEDLGKQETAYTEEDATTCFASDLALVRFKFNRPSYLIFDEVENLCFDVSSSEHWRSGENFLPFWQAIRSTYQQSTNMFSFLMCGTNPYPLETAYLPGGVDNPIYKYIEPYYLGFFNVDDVERMISHLGFYMGVTFDREVYTYLTDDFGGHPFLIKQACSFLRLNRVTENVPRKIHIRKEEYRAARDQIKAHTRNYIALILQVLTERFPREFSLLKHLAVDDKKLFNAYAEDDPRSIEHLVGYGLIEKVTQDFCFRIKLVEAAVQYDARDLACPESLEERWALLSKERNQFEFGFRELVRSVVKMGYGAKAGKDFIIGCLNKQVQIEKARCLDFDDIFRGEMYFLDLKRAVLKDWDRYRFIFNDDKTKFSEYVDAANKFRSDAHAETITKEEFRSVMPKLVWLTKALKDNS
ncbi:ATP-binding protein [Undibacterium sp. CY22W]|uniref:ATP-binding protein n=1 Tax=Undibacterium curvum TaxID=2762294 RepID=A0ABR7A330_9BURK|nr:ATP-binding protein [Undibacterium curvum]